MPLRLPAFSRRTFMAQAGLAAVCAPALHSAGKAVDENCVAILNDTHIAAQHPENSPIPTRLREAVTSLVQLKPRLAAVVINGDLALNDGQPGDYVHFARLIEPLRQAGIPVHLTLGNHDNRDVFYEVLAAEKDAAAPVSAKHAGMVALPNANLFLLDSLKGLRVAHGMLGTEQLAWLARMLDTHADKPALVVAHHNPRLGGDEKHFPGGLEDSDPLWDLLVSRPHAKAYVHGHIHHRDYFLHRGIHILNTPATGFVSRPAESTTGWTLAQFTPDGGEFTTFTHLRSHPWNNAVQKLAWRDG